MEATSKEERVGVDQRYMQDNFEYDNGRLVRKAANGPGSKVGHWEWSINRHGYSKIKIKQSTFEIHRLIWVMHNGCIPAGLQVDHINRDSLDNRNRTTDRTASHYHLPDPRRTPSRAADDLCRR